MNDNGQRGLVAAIVAVMLGLFGFMGCSVVSAMNAPVPIPPVAIEAPVVDPTPARSITIDQAAINAQNATGTTDLSGYQPSESPSYSPSYSRAEDGEERTVHVRGYTRANGTYVAPYTRRAPRRR